jgi:tripartite ATP-independent transporter DctM subunit
MKTAVKIFHKTENALIFLALMLMFILPISDIITRIFRTTGIHGSADFQYHLVVIVTMLGAMLASREKLHISLSVLNTIFTGKAKTIIEFFCATVCGSIVFSIAFSSISFVQNAWSPQDSLAGLIPKQIIMSIIPVGFFVVGLRSIICDKKLHSILAFVIAISFPFLLALIPFELVPAVSTILIFVILVATILGLPIFAALGGIAALLFFKTDIMTNAIFGKIMIADFPIIANEAYSVLTSPIFPSIPLFTMAGFILSESKAGERLVGFFKSLLGSVPGGMAIMAVIVCAFFTTFTGASGVTILALGGLLSFVLIKQNYSEKFTTGYITASGSIGLLFPPSLPIILYGVQSQTNIKHLFAGGIFPGIVFVSALAIYAVITQRKNLGEKIPFNFKDLTKNFAVSSGEIILPILILLLFFNGIAVIVETGAIAILYLSVLIMFIHRDFSIKEFPKIIIKAAPIAGSVLIILAMAKGLSYYIVDAQIPEILTAWCKENIHSKWMFLLILNLVLLFAGFFMDIFSAIVVLVPLILPISQEFGIDPIHLGIIFLANMELSYLTPPVGLNLFLASIRFKKPLHEIYKSVIPFMIIMVIAVLLITYIPAITDFGVKLFAGK